MIAPTAAQPSSDTTAANKPVNYSDQYISFTYPGNLEILPSQKNAGYLDIVTLYSNNTDHNNEQATISVVRGTAANDSGVNYRKTHTNLYQEQSSSPGTIIFSRSQNGHEKTAYITHGDLLASISLTVPGSKDLSSDFAMILNSFRWK